MSFSADVKKELSKLNNLKNKEEVKAELLGYLATSNITSTGNNYKYTTENEYNINRFAKLLNNIGIENYKIEIIGKNYVIRFKRNFDLVDVQEEIKNENAKKAFIRGTFLGSGSLNEPKNKYHLEIILTKNKIAEFLLETLKEFNVNVKILEKGKDTSVYIKDGDAISKFLALIGANTAVLKFEEIRVIRDMKNNVNRLVNCETANMNKTIDASVEQINIIKQLKKSGKFDMMPNDLKEIAQLREKNPDATLIELGNMLEKKIGKSSVSYRFKKIREYL